MKREFDYETITLQDIANNPHLIFICDGDKNKVIVEERESK